MMIEKSKMLGRYLSEFHISTLAGSASFFIVLSIFPLLTLVFSLIRYLPLTLQDLLGVLGDIFPAALMGMMEEILMDLYTTNVVAVVSITVLVALWSASRGVFGILNGLNMILGSNEYRGYLRRRMTALFYTFLLILALILTLGLQVFGKSILYMIAKWDIELFHVISKVANLRFLFTTAVLALFFMLVFAYFPAKHLHLRNVFPGAIVTAFGWMAFSYLFSIYVDYGGGSRFYGSMATLMLSFLWLYICMCILFFGGVLCRLSVDGRLNFRTFQEFLHA